ncbi:MAG: SPOR domain-containing protein, partial [Gammaproteobacteria bacterium]
PETETAAAARPQQTVIGKISGPETDSAVLPRIANPVQPNGPPKPQTSGPSPTTDPAFVAAIPSDLSIGPNPDRSKTGFQDEPEDEQSNGQGNRAEPVNTQKDAESQEAVSRVSEPLVAPLIEDVVQTTPRASETPSEAPNSTSFEGVPGSRWIRAQDPGHFTLQILATVKPEALKQFLKTNPKLGGLAVFTMNRNGTTWYALIKGVYPSLDQAKQAARNLPGGLQKAWPRTFRSVHQAMIESDSE